MVKNEMRLNILTKTSIRSKFHVQLCMLVLKWINIVKVTTVRRRSMTVKA